MISGIAPEIGEGGRLALLIISWQTARQLHRRVAFHLTSSGRDCSMALTPAIDMPPSQAEIAMRRANKLRPASGGSIREGRRLFS